MSVVNSAKWIRRISYSLAIILLLLLTVDILINYTLENNLRAELHKIREAEINFESAHANIFTFSIVLINVDVSYFGANRRDLFHKFSLEEIKFGGINVFKWLNKKELSSQHILLKNGTISLDKYLLDTKDTVKTKDTDVITISAHTIDFTNVNLKIHKDEKIKVACTGELHLEKFNSSAPKEFKSFACRLHNVLFEMTGTHGQVLNVNDILINSDKSEAILDSVRIVTPFDKKEFAKKLGFQTDYIDASAKQVSMEGLDVLAILKNKVVSKKISIEKPKLYVYRDRRIPDRAKEERMPDIIISDLETTLRIDTLTIHDADVKYEERPEQDPDTTGIISFSHTNSVTYHLYNHPATGDQETMTTVSTSQLTGNGSVDVKFVFPIVKGKNYYVKGEFKHLNLTSLNNSCINLGHIKIKSGQLNSLAFDFSFDHKLAKGKIIGDYDNLEIEKLKVDKNGDLKKAKFKSVVEQTLVIPRNKDKSMPEKQRTGKINFKREPDKFVWNFMLNSLLDGIRASFNLGFLLPG